MLFKKKRFIPLLTLILCTVLAISVPIPALAATTIDVSDFDTLTVTTSDGEEKLLKDYFSATATYEITGTASAANSAITLSATGTNASGSGCNTTEAQPSTTTVTLTAAQTVSVKVTCDDTVEITDVSVTKNEDGTKSFTVANGAPVSFSVTAGNATPVEETITFETVDPTESKVPKDCAIYSVGGNSYDYLDKAVDAAGTSGTIVVTKTGTVYHSDVETDADYASKEIKIDIPAGITLLVPYSASDLSIKAGTATENDFKHANVNFQDNPEKEIIIANEDAMNPETDVVYTLTIPSGVTLTVNGTSENPGRVIIGGTILGSEGTNSTIAEGLCYGPHSNLMVDGNLNLGNYSVLSAIGYVLGNGEIKTINSDGTNSTGAEIYQPFVIHDWRGGRAAQFGVTTTGTFGSTALSTQSGEAQVIPFFQWTTMNIRPKLTMTYGNSMIMYASLYDGTAYTSHATLVGSSGLVQLGQNASLTSYYEDIDWGSYIYGFPGRNNVTISGDASLGSFTMTGRTALGSVDINTANFTLPICYGYSITLDNGNFNLNNPMSLLPGSKIEVTSTATLNVNATRFMIFDGLNQGLKHSTSSTGITSAYAQNSRSGSQKVKLYPTTGELQGATVNGSAMSADAELIVNGTLVIGANANFGGVIQTSGVGTIDATAGTAGKTTGTSVQIGVVGNKAIMALSENSSIAGMSLHEMNAQVVSAATGERFDIVRGVTYTGSKKLTTQTGYSFKYYPNAANTGYVVLVGDAELASGETLVAANGTTTTGATAQTAHPLNETINGGWLCQTHTGVETDHTCDVCGYVTPHVDADNNLVCDICSAKLFKLVSMNAAADARTDLILTFQVHESLVSEDAVSVSFEGSESTEAEIEVDATANTVTVTQPIASGLMTQNVVVSFKDGTNAAYAVGTSDTSISRSIVDYARLVLQQTDSNYDAAKELVTAMVIYGGYAQTLFDVDAENPAYMVLKDFLTADQITALHAAVSGVSKDNIKMTLYDTLPDGFITGENAKPVTQNVVLDSAIEQTVYFYLQDGFTLSGTVELSYITNVGGATKVRTLTPMYDTGNGRYYVTIKNIPAALLNYDYTITGKVNDEEFTITPSIASYMQRVIESGGDIGNTGENDDTKGARKSLVQAMWLYNQAAYKFFSQGIVTEVSQ